MTDFDIFDCYRLEAELTLIEKDLTIINLEQSSTERLQYILQQLKTSVDQYGTNNHFVEALGEELNVIVDGQDFASISKEEAEIGIENMLLTAGKKIVEFIKNLIRKIIEMVEKMVAFINEKRKQFISYLTSKKIEKKKNLITSGKVLSAWIDRFIHESHRDKVKKKFTLTQTSININSSDMDFLFSHMVCYASFTGKEVEQLIKLSSNISINIQSIVNDPSKALDSVSGLKELLNTYKFEGDPLAMLDTRSEFSESLIDKTRADGSKTNSDQGFNNHNKAHDYGTQCSTNLQSLVKILEAIQKALNNELKQIKDSDEDVDPIVKDRVTVFNNIIRLFRNIDGCLSTIMNHTMTPINKLYQLDTIKTK